MVLALLALAVFVPLLAVLWSQLGSRRPRLTVTSGWIEELSPNRYHAMVHLLNQDDFKALRSQPGYKPQMATRLRAQRCATLRGYLRCLDADFKRICLALRIIMLRSKRDRPDLAVLLIRKQARFTCGMAMVQFRLLLYRWGVCSVDVTDLVAVFDGMRQQLQSSAPAAAPIGA